MGGAGERKAERATHHLKIEASSMAEKITMEDVKKAFSKGHLHHNHMELVFQRLALAERLFKQISALSTSELEKKKHEPLDRPLATIRGYATDFLEQK